jgi:hypothetical protein
MSTSSPAQDVNVYSTGTRAVNPVTFRNTSSVDCPDSGFIVLLMQDSSEPEPTLQWRIDGGAWHGTYLSWDNGVVDGNASCASPCWKTGMITLDMPAHTTYTLDLAVIFNSGQSGFFPGAVYYTGQAVIPDGATGPMVAFAYEKLTGSAAGGSGSGSGGGTSGHSTSSVADSSAVRPSRSAAASPKASASPSPSASAASATPTVSAAPAATPAASPNLATVADVHSGGSGMSGLITLIAVVVLALAVGAGFVLTRRRRGSVSADS